MSAKYYQSVPESKDKHKKNNEKYNIKKEIVTKISKAKVYYLEHQFSKAIKESEAISLYYLDLDLFLTSLMLHRQLMRCFFELKKYSELLKLAKECSEVSELRLGELKHETLIIKNTYLYWLIELGSKEQAYEVSTALLNSINRINNKSEVIFTIKYNCARATLDYKKDNEAKLLLNDSLIDLAREKQTYSSIAYKIRELLIQIYVQEGNWKQARYLQVFQRHYCRRDMKQNWVYTDKDNEKNKLENLYLAEHNYAYYCFRYGEIQEAISIWESLFDAVAEELLNDRYLLIEICYFLLMVFFHSKEYALALTYSNYLINLSQKFSDINKEKEIKEVRMDCYKHL